MLRKTLDTREEPDYAILMRMGEKPTLVRDPGGIVPFLTNPNVTVISYTGRDHHE